ncbi:MAG: pilus assembly protein TadG-related protein, partial [Vicinamibacterales bacterium]
MSFIYVGLGFMAFLAASTLAIDVGMFMTARSQAQTSADAGALAGATALAFNDYDDRSAGGPAVQAAITTAQQNAIMAGTPSVTVPDITFPLGPTGLDNRVRVNVFRTAPRSNPLPTLIGPIFGVPTVDISATATAEAAPANAMTCVKPFTIPDRWEEVGDPPWTVDSSFERYHNKGRLLKDPDRYIKPWQSGYQGYNMYDDVGALLTIRAGTGNNISPSMYWSWKMPGGTGGDYYRDNIANCNQ